MVCIPILLLIVTINEVHNKHSRMKITYWVFIFVASSSHLQIWNQSQCSSQIWAARVDENYSYWMNPNSISVYIWEGLVLIFFVFFFLSVLIFVVWVGFPFKNEISSAPTPASGLCLWCWWWLVLMLWPLWWKSSRSYNNEFCFHY